MKVEIINKPMLCWDDDETDAREYHVLAKVTECDTQYPYKIVCNENSPFQDDLGVGSVVGFKHAKPLPETIELTLDEIADKFGISVEQLKIKE